jgi:hypothetical protein
MSDLATSAQDLEEWIVHGEELGIADTVQAQYLSSVVSGYLDHEGGVIWFGRWGCWVSVVMFPVPC